MGRFNYSMNVSPGLRTGQVPGDNGAGYGEIGTAEPRPLGRVEEARSC